MPLWPRPRSMASGSSLRFSGITPACPTWWASQWTSGAIRRARSMSGCASMCVKW
jgi:hypothetical protein